MGKLKEKNQKFWSEFKAFALRGNVIDLAVGVIIGGAFQNIVKSVVNDLIMPFISLLIGGTNFNDRFAILKPGEDGNTVFATVADAKEAGATVFSYGNFITEVINFVIMAFIIFLLVKGINKLTRLGRKKEEEEAAPPAPTTKKCPYCCSEIAIEATRCPHCTSKLDE